MATTWMPRAKFILNHGGRVNRSDSVSQHVNTQNLYHRCLMKGRKASGTESIFEEKNGYKVPKFTKRYKPTDSINWPNPYLISLNRSMPGHMWLTVKILIKGRVPWTRCRLKAYWLMGKHRFKVQQTPHFKHQDQKEETQPYLSCECPIKWNHMKIFSAKGKRKDFVSGIMIKGSPGRNVQYDGNTTDNRALKYVKSKPVGLKEK